MLGLAGVPAGWLSGAIVAVAIAALAGRPMAIPGPLMRANFVLIGISLGAVVTPETLRGVTTWPLSIAILVVATTCISVASGQYLRLVHRWNKATAYLAAAPGAMSQAMIAAAEIGADLRAVVIVQTMRVVIVAVVLPGTLALFGIVGESAGGLGGTFDAAQLDELAILVAVSTAVAVGLQYAGFPGGLLFGSMLCSAALHGSGLIQVTMPWWVAIIAMISLGSVAGARFSNTSLRLLGVFMGAALGSFAVAAVIAFLFALVLVALLPLPVADVMIAFAPGGVDAMMLLALALNLDPVYVGAHHLVRVFFVLILVSFLARRRRREAPAPTPQRTPKPPTFQD